MGKIFKHEGYNHGKISLTSLEVLEIKMKRVSFFHVTLAKKITMQHVEKATGKQLNNCLKLYKLLPLHRTTLWQIILKLKMHIPRPSIAILRIFYKETSIHLDKQTIPVTWMAALFVIEKTWKPHEFPSANRIINDGIFIK